MQKYTYNISSSCHHQKSNLARFGWITVISSFTEDETCRNFHSIIHSHPRRHGCNPEQKTGEHFPLNFKLKYEKAKSKSRHGSCLELNGGNYGEYLYLFIVI